MWNWILLGWFQSCVAVPRESILNHLTLSEFNGLNNHSKNHQKICNYCQEGKLSNKVVDGILKRNTKRVENVKDGHSTHS